jgi:hypothetical protein
MTEKRVEGAPSCREKLPVALRQDTGELVGNLIEPEGQ